eukprot:11314732-Alexandrium_andersonii.AAC.1
MGAPPEWSSAGRVPAPGPSCRVGASLDVACVGIRPTGFTPKASSRDRSAGRGRAQPPSHKPLSQLARGGIASE